MARAKSVKKKAKSRTSNKADSSSSSSRANDSGLGTEIDTGYEDEMNVLNLGAAETLEDDGITFENMEKSISHHHSIRLPDETRIRRGDKIWYLSRITSDVLGDKTIEDMDDIPDECFDVAEVLSVCQFRVYEGAEPVFYLRVQHYYTEKQAMALTTLHPDFKIKLKNYQLWDDERICSDHVDFISTEAYAGHADGIWCTLELRGLEVSDKERLLPLHERPRCEQKVELDGWSLREKACREEAREEAEREREELARARQQARQEKRVSKGTSSHRRNADESQQIW